MGPRHLLLALAVAVIWGINFVVIDVGLRTFPPLLFAALRFLLVAVPGVFLVRRPDIPWRWIVAVGLTLSTGQFALLFVGIQQGMPAGLASLVLQVQAVFTFVLGVVLLRERPSRLQLAGVLVALVGIGVIGLGRQAGVPLVALLLTIGAAGSWAAGNICTRLARSPSPLGLVVWSALVPPLPLLALSLVFEGPSRIGDSLAGVDAGGILCLLYIVVLSTWFGYGTWTWLLSHHPASRVAPFSLLVPVVGIAAAAVTLGEQPNGWELAGAVVVLAGIALTTFALRGNLGQPARVAAACRAS
jgi:O-acetylserine/cysteine efflux transporter